MNAETEFEISMLRGALDWHRENGSEDSDLAQSLRDMLAELQDHIAHNGAGAGLSHNGEKVKIEDSPFRKRPGTGSGRGIVRFPSDKQMRFLGTLVSRKRIPADSGEQFALSLYRHDADPQNAAKPRLLNLVAASDLISWLLTLPDSAGAAGKPARLATARQLEHICKEGARRDVTHTPTQATVARALAGQPVEFSDASAALDILFSAGFKPRESDALEAGVYLVDGKAVKIQISQSSGKPYALALDPHKGKFNYVKGLILTVKPSDRITLEQAKEFGIRFGVCCVCARTLTAERSVEDGIGPVCRKRL